MAFEKLEFTKSWENTQDFPTYEPSEAQVRADLQLLHDEARDGLNRLVDALNDPTAAAQVPFQAAGLEADNVQDAVMEVYGAVQDAAAGQIVNGSITKEKLDYQLLERVYGGRPWVSLDTPGAAQTPEAGFPVGQIWLRPAFTVDNLAGPAWSVSAGTVGTVENGWKLTGNGTMAAVSMGQSLTGLGTAGQRIFASLRTAEADSQLTGLTLYLNGKACNLLTGGGVFEAALDSQGSLSVLVTAQWPAAALAVGSVKLTHWAVVNAARIEEQQEGCAPLTDWPGLLETLAPFTSRRLGLEVYMQTAPGQWERTGQEILPVERGGTGLNDVPAGRLLCGTGGGSLAALDAPEHEGSMLRYADGKMAWAQEDQVVQALGSLRVMTGSYAGTGVGRSVTLPVTPVLLLIYPRTGASVNTLGTVENNPIILGNGASASECYTSAVSGGTANYTCSVSLSGNVVTFQKNGGSSASDASDKYGNQSGVMYSWVAVY